MSWTLLAFETLPKVPEQELALHICLNTRSRPTVQASFLTGHLEEPPPDSGRVADVVKFKYITMVSDVLRVYRVPRWWLPYILFKNVPQIQTH